MRPAPGGPRGSGTYINTPYRWHLIDGAGRFPHEELPEPVRPGTAVFWLLDPEPEQ